MARRLDGRERTSVTRPESGQASSRTNATRRKANTYAEPVVTLILSEGFNWSERGLIGNVRKQRLQKPCPLRLRKCFRISAVLDDSDIAKPLVCEMNEGKNYVLMSNNMTRS
jgi:hypothetical protein